MCCFVLPGTTRLPGSYKENERQAPRLVKTYTERLKEMKRQHRPYHKPPQARQRVDPGQSEAGLPNLPVFITTSTRFFLMSTTLPVLDFQTWQV